MSTFEQKLNISFNSAILFYLINLPFTYNLTSNLINTTLISMNCPANLGIILHTLVFFIITYLSMSSAKINEGIKIKHSLYGTLIYYFISSPAFYTSINMIFNIGATCPNDCGLLLLSILYCFALVSVMYLPN